MLKDSTLIRQDLIVRSFRLPVVAKTCNSVFYGDFKPNEFRRFFICLRMKVTARRFKRKHLNNP